MMPFMGLRARLAAFFVVITVAPLTVAVFALQFQIDRQLVQRSVDELEGVRRAGIALIEARRARATDLAGDLVERGAPEQLAAEDPEATARWLAEWGDEVADRADFALLVGADGSVFAAAVTPPRFSADAPPVPTSAEDLAAAAVQRIDPPGALLAVSEVRGVVEGVGESPLGWVVTGIWTDERLLEALAITGGTALVVDGQVMAAGGDLRLEPGALPEDGELRVVRDDGREEVFTSAPLGAEGAAAAIDLVISSVQPTRPPAWRLAMFVVLPAVVLAGLLGWLLAASVVAPVRRAGEVALAVAEGDLNQTLPATGGKELADLATALNTMSQELAARLSELERSRDQLRGSLARLGQTLSSSLDLNRTLAVVVETAKDTLGADQALLMLFTPERDALYAKVGRGLDAPPPRLRLGEGIAGWVAQTGTPVLLPADAERGLEPAEGEPTAEAHLAVPMLGRGRVIGVLTLLARDLDREFTVTDLDTMRSFAAQASVAIENVMLHQEAQRLSVTDPLTGLWNFRYFQLQADREVESAGRFERTLSLLVVDLDFFKEVNDQYGHQVGDEVLVEVARRLRASVRVPDVVARYGGEEFVVLLPGTDLPGALATAERIRLAVGGEPVRITGGAVSSRDRVEPVAPLLVTASLGVSTFAEHGRTVAGLLRSADAAMYSAKRQGRDRVVGAGEHDEEPARSPE